MLKYAVFVAVKFAGELPEPSFAVFHELGLVILPDVE